MIVTPILQRVFAREFYNANTAFFILAVGVCFGFMSGVEHKALAQYFISSPVMLSIPVSIWTAYTLKVILFNKKTVALPGNEFMYNFTLLAKGTQWFASCCLLVNQLIPIIAYGIFLIVMALQYNVVITVVYVIFSLLVLTFISVALFINNLQCPTSEKSGATSFFTIKINRSYFQFPIEWLIRNDATTFIGTKLFSYLLIWFVMRLYTTDVYDVRLLGMVLTIAFTVNLPIIFLLHRFENYHFAILRNLPLTLTKRLINFLVVFSIISLPELGLVVKIFPSYLTTFDLIQLIIFCMSIVLFLYTIVYIKDIELGQFARRGFLTGMAWVILILFSIPPGIMAAANFAGGIILFRIYYYKFEYMVISSRLKDHGPSQ